METKTAETFAELNLSDITLRALAKLGYEKPSPIQAKVIPWALEGYDVIGQARTGTGKTASFAIPILEQLDPLRVCPLPQALVLVPTRELAAQVHGEFVKLAYGCPTEILEVAGGTVPLRVTSAPRLKSDTTSVCLYLKFGAGCAPKNANPIS